MLSAIQIGVSDGEFLHKHPFVQDSVLNLGGLTLGLAGCESQLPFHK